MGKKKGKTGNKKADAEAKKELGNKAFLSKDY